MQILTKVAIFNALRQSPRQVLLPLSLALLSLAALFIPAAEYIQWDNYTGLGFCALVAFFIVKSVMSESLDTVFAYRRGGLAYGVAAVTVIVFFLCTNHPRGFFEKPNTIEIYSNSPGFVINDLIGKGIRLPCAGYTPKEGNKGWELTRGQRGQSYVCRETSRPFIIFLSSEFIQNNKIVLEVQSPNVSEVCLCVNNHRSTIKMNNGTQLIQLRQFSLWPISGNRHILIDFIQLSGQLCIVFVAICFFSQLIAIRYRGNSVSWRLMFFLIIVFIYAAIPNLLIWTSPPDLAGLEPNLPRACGTTWGFKHPVFIQFWWQIAMIIIPVRSCWFVLSIALILQFFVSLLMIESLLCNLKSRWLAWLVFFTMIQCVCLCDNIITDARWWLHVDYLLIVSAMFVIGCIAISISRPIKRILKYCLVIACLFSIYTVMVTRHEALGVSLALCIGLAGAFFSADSLLQRRHFLKILMIGTLLCILLYGFHRFVEQRYLLPIKHDYVKSVLNTEMRRFMTTDILRIAYCHNNNYDSLPVDVLSCFNDKLRNKFVVRWWGDFKSVSSERIKTLWLHSIKTYPKAYLRSKFISICIWLNRLDYQMFNIQSASSDVFLSGTEGLGTKSLKKPQLFLPLPTLFAWLSLILCMVISGIMIYVKPKLRNIVWFAFIMSSAGFLHMLAWIVIPTTLFTRYIYWTYCSGTICFCLLLYLIPNVVKCLLKKQSWDVLYDEPTEERS